MKQSQPDSEKNDNPLAGSVTGGAAPKIKVLSRRRLWLFRIAAMLLGPAIFFVAVEFVLRLAGYGYDPDFFKPQLIGGKSFLVQNEDFSRRFFPPETMRQPNALRMRADKPPGSIRIFVLGESAAMGDPEPGFGPSRFLEVLLQQQFPEQDFEVINVAFTAINSHVILPLARECAKHDGDLWIIYMGNNEMVGPFGAATILGTQAPPRSYVRLVTAIQRTRIGQLGMAIVRRLQSPATHSGSWGGMAMFQQQRVAPNSPKREAVYQNFAANLDDILQRGLHSGAAIILNTVAVNLHDSPPFASLTDDNLAPAARTRFESLFQSALKSQTTENWTNAGDLFGAALQIDGGYAEAHYRKAMCLEKIDRLAAARAEYQLACDTDALPFRTDSRENAIIRAAAARNVSNHLMYLDTADELARDGTNQVCGQESFYEHVHFNFDGGYRLGLVWAKAVARMRSELTQRLTTNAWASQYRCESRLGLTDWNRKLVIESVLQRFRAPPLNTQFNNAERLNRLSVYERSLLANANEQSVQRAREIFATAIAARPEDHHILEAYAVFLQAGGDFAGALHEWQRVSKLLPHDFLAWFQIGSIMTKHGDLTQGEINLRKALKCRPGLVEGWSELGQCLGAHANWPPALDAFERACRLRPEDPTLWAFRAKVLGSLERRPEAIECYRKAVELNPAYAEAQAALGDQYSMAGKIPEAITAYQAAVRAKPNYAVAHLNLGLMFLRQGRPNEASGEFRQTLSLEPGNAVAQDYLNRIEARRALNP